MTTCKVYRNGTIGVGAHSASIVELWSGYDAFKPAGRSGRLESMYASPSIEGLVRWVRGNHLTSANDPDVDLKNNQITVLDAENVYVYSIELYDLFFSQQGVSEDHAKTYWASGIRLSDWEKMAKERNLLASEWEVLVPIENVSTVVAISDARIVKNAHVSIANEVANTLKARKEFMKWNG